MLQAAIVHKLDSMRKSMVGEPDKANVNAMAMPPPSADAQVSTHALPLQVAAREHWGYQA